MNYLLNKINPPVKKVGFTDIQELFKHDRTYILINTFSSTDQTCLIKNTINCLTEESIINKSPKSCIIIIYGMNCIDDAIYAKYNTLTSIGFTEVYVYPGGLFEWLCLQDIYGAENFPSTSIQVDLLKYTSPTIFTF
jgi:hypothetical protein